MEFCETQETLLTNGVIILYLNTIRLKDEDDHYIEASNTVVMVLTSNMVVMVFQSIGAPAKGQHSAQVSILMRWKFLKLCKVYMGVNFDHAYIEESLGNIPNFRVIECD